MSEMTIEELVAEAVQKRNSLEFYNTEEELHKQNMRLSRFKDTLTGVKYTLRCQNKTLGTFRDTLDAQTKTLRKNGAMLIVCLVLSASALFLTIVALTF